MCHPQTWRPRSLTSGLETQRILQFLRTSSSATQGGGSSMWKKCSKCGKRNPEEQFSSSSHRERHTSGAYKSPRRWIDQTLQANTVLSDELFAEMKIKDIKRRFRIDYSECPNLALKFRPTPTKLSVWNNDIVNLSSAAVFRVQNQKMTGFLSIKWIIVN